jgi:DNA oxidative demethylase
MADLLSVLATPVVAITPGVFYLPQRVASASLRPVMDAVMAVSPLRHLQTRMGKMSVALTNCGRYGWHADASGYRYVEIDPLTRQPWPAMPTLLAQLAQTLAAEVGFMGFQPDCCLLNYYAVGAKMGAHRDFDEQDYRWPIVSISLGLSADFIWHGEQRTNPGIKLRLNDGDVVVFGGVARRGYHAVRPLKKAPEPAVWTERFNLTFRRAR